MISARILVVDDEADLPDARATRGGGRRRLRQGHPGRATHGHGADAPAGDARDLPQPGEVLTRLNASRCRDMPPSMFVTLVLAALDPSRPGRVVLAGGGHPGPVIMRADRPAAAASLGPASGTVLGVFPDSAFEQVELDLLTPGDTLVLLTDGIVEAQSEDGHRPGIPALLPLFERERARSAPALADRLTADVLERAGSRLQDDMTVFVLN